MFEIEGGCWSLGEVYAGHAVLTYEDQLFGLAPDGESTATLSASGSPRMSTSVSSNFFDIALPQAGPPPLQPTVTFTR